MAARGSSVSKWRGCACAGEPSSGNYKSGDDGALSEWRQNAAADLRTIDEDAAAAAEAAAVERTGSLAADDAKACGRCNGFDRARSHLGRMHVEELEHGHANCVCHENPRCERRHHGTDKQNQRKQEQPPGRGESSAPTPLSQSFSAENVDI